MMDWPVLLLAAPILIVVVLYMQFRWRNRRILQAASSLPSPPCWPILGNAWFFTGGVTSITRHIVKFTREFKGMFCLWVGPAPVFVVSDPTDVQTILNSSNTLEKDDIYQFLKPFLGNGLFTASVPVWKKYRRLITPVLNRTNVELYQPDFNDVSRELCKELGFGAALDPRVKIFSASVDAVIRTVIARQHVDDETKIKIHFLLNSVGRLFTYRLFKVWLHIEWVFKTIYRKELKEIFKKVSECLEVFDMQWRDEEMKRNSPSEVTETGLNDNMGRNNLINVAWANPATEDHQWSHEVFTMIVGATDTVVAGVSFLLITLANHPEAQTKIRTEIKDVIGDSISDVTTAELNQMQYLGCALMEAMRIHGVFPVILRKATKDTKLTNCTLPTGSRIMLALHAMGWDPVKFTEPEKFKPERFLDNAIDKNSFLPFSGGPRGCPGKTYAMLFMKTVVVHLLRKYHLTSPIRLEDIEYELKVVMFSKTPLPIYFEPVKE